MLPSSALADRAALLMLRLLTAVSLLFLAGFVAALLSAREAAAAASCAGGDLLVAMQKDDPAKAAAIVAEAAKTPNGKGLLWSVEKDGRRSYLYGTIHMTDPRVVTLGPAAAKAFDGARTVVIETTDVLDKASMTKALLSRPDLTMFTDGTTLTSLLPEGEVAAVEKALDERGIPLASVAKMKPWMLSAMLALPACELARQADGEPVLDMKLAEQAKADGKALRGLETAVDQLEAMASLPMAFHVTGLVDTLKLGDRVNDVVETMIVLYQKGDTGMFWPLFRAALPSSGDDGTSYAAFEETMVTARNHTMAERAAPILADGDAFIAVGALHLPGPQGLVELLRKAGYTVTAVN